MILSAPAWNLDFPQNYGSKRKPALAAARDNCKAACAPAVWSCGQFCSVSKDLRKLGALRWCSTQRRRRRAKRLSIFPCRLRTEAAQLQHAITRPFPQIARRTVRRWHPMRSAGFCAASICRLRQLLAALRIVVETVERFSHALGGNLAHFEHGKLRDVAPRRRDQSPPARARFRRRHCGPARSGLRLRRRARS